MKSKKKWLFFFYATLIGLVLFLIPSSQQLDFVNNAYAKSSIPYRCASVHFGMNDATLKAKTYNLTKDFSSSALKKYPFSNLTYVNSSGTNCFLSSTSIVPIKIGSNYGGGGFSIQFEETFYQCCIYAFSDLGTTLKVNGGDSIRIDKGEITIPVKGVSITYTPYIFEFETTNKIILSTSSDLYVADITFRIV